MNTSLALIVLGVALSLPAYAHSEVYKHVDEKGNVTYSNMPMKGAKKIELEPITTVPGLPSKKPAANAQSSEESQRKAVEEKRRVLQGQITEEEKLLAEAKEALKAGQDMPETYRGAGGKIYRNVAKYEEKVKELEEQVSLHERNLQLLTEELAALK